jgi:hypothetical protein
MKNVAFSIVGDLAIAVYGAQNPTDEEIEESLKVFTTLNPARVRSLIISAGGSPSPLQRKLLLDALGGGEHLSAVLSDATKVRGAVTALSWFNKKIKAFARAKMAEALAHLSVPPAQFDAVQREVKRLEKELGIQS